MSAQRITPIRPLPDPERQLARAKRALVIFLFYLAAMIQGVYAMRWNLSPDEAFYWLLSRHLRMGYLDHPPGIAALINFTTSLIGQTELGVRAGMIAMSLATILILVKLCQILFKEATAFWLMLAIGLTSPLLTGLGLVATPDTPAMFFSTAALAIAVIIARKLEPPEPTESPKRPKQSTPLGPPIVLPWWIAFGIFCGLALLSKYTAILLPASIVLAMLTSPTGRSQLRRPGIYMSAVVALLVFSPVLIWNSQHDWISFKFQLHHGLDSESADAHLSWLRAFCAAVIRFVEFLGGQLVIWTPVLFVLGTVAFVNYARRYRALPLAWRMLLWSAIFPLLFFGYAATRSHSEPNWPAFAYMPLSLLTVGFVVANYKSERGNWLRIGIIVAFMTNALLHSPELIYKAEVLVYKVANIQSKPRLPKKLADFYGWREFGRALDQVTEHGFAPVVCPTHEEAGEAAFYQANQPDAWAASVGENSRPTAFDTLDLTPPWQDSQYLVLVNFGKDIYKFCDKYHYTKMPLEHHWAVYPFGHERDRSMIVCEKIPSSQPSSK